ncbi:unnamed protein product [Acanthocheilonema viteae]|uniref:Uncharacterized protein n=1 Tax=Acanthocheilonema viteae TaxID=6277 RepID=A0A498SIP6_ACAVI|nr:unnamed protein product [Acanthocheilonema viteae]
MNSFQRIHVNRRKHLKHLPPIPVKPTVQRNATALKFDGSKSSRDTNLPTQLAAISIHSETAMLVKLDDKPMLSSRMHERSYPSSGILPIHPFYFMSIDEYNDMNQFYRKIECESPSLLSSDQGSHISGYDSIDENFADFTQSTTDTERQSASRKVYICVTL